MRIADYRERLGIGLDDSAKLEALKNKLYNMVLTLGDKTFTKEISFFYLLDVGKKINRAVSSSVQISHSFLECTSLKDLIFHAVILHNSFKKENGDEICKQNRMMLLNFLKKCLKDLNILYDIVEDDDGFFIFPKGVADFDENLVSATLSWLKDYPKAEEAWTKALRNYSENSDQPSSVADDFRKALETFFQEYFGSNKSLENMLTEYCEYLKGKGVPSEISDDFRKVLDAYTKFNNAYAKHHDKTSSNVLEYIMYSTGNIMRLLITLKTS